MKYTDIVDYIDGLDNLTKIELTIEADEYGNFYVVKTKETFVYGTEDEADAKVDSVRLKPGFAGVDRKFKAGKMNKAGEVTKEETWSVIAKLNK